MSPATTRRFSDDFDSSESVNGEAKLPQLLALRERRHPQAAQAYRATEEAKLPHPTREQESEETRRVPQR